MTYTGLRFLGVGARGGGVPTLIGHIGIIVLICYVFCRRGLVRTRPDPEADELRIEGFS